MKIALVICVWLKICHLAEY